MTVDSDGKYWNSFYDNEKLGIEVIPSQFAAFVMGEFHDIDNIIEVGCGVGRDALFFASMGKRVIGLDASTAAIRICESRSKSESLNASFMNYDISNNKYSDLELCNFYNFSSKTLVYARFFLHAIDEESEGDFFEFCQKVCHKKGSIALEFRTERDINQSKETGKHYRRYINSLGFMKRVVRHGFQVDYFVEGFGFAKYKQDDAHVARFILSPV